MVQRRRLAPLRTRLFVVGRSALVIVVVFVVIIITMTAPIFKNGEWLLPDDHEAQERERERKGLGGSDFGANKAKFEREYLDREHGFGKKLEEEKQE